MKARLWAYKSRRDKAKDTWAVSKGGGPRASKQGEAEDC